MENEFSGMPQKLESPSASGGGSPDRIKVGEDNLVTWLVKDEKEWKDLPDGRLKILIRNVARRPDSMAGPEYLRSIYDEIDKMLQDRTIKDSDAALWQARIVSRYEELEKNKQNSITSSVSIEKQSEEKTAPSEQEIKRVAMKLLDRIESNDLHTYDIQLGQITNQLQELALNLDTETQREIQTRLKLQDCFVAVKAALTGGGNSFEGGTKNIGGLFINEHRELNSRGRILEGSDFYNLFVKEFPGLQISKAFDLLQEAAFTKKYGVMIFEKDTSQLEQEQIYKKIAKDLGGDSKNAEKSVKLALRLAWATLEVSTWNNDLQGNDPLAEAIYFRAYREGKGQAGADRGPDITVPLIVGFGSSYLRMATLPGKKRTPLYNPRELVIEESDKKRETKVNLRGIGEGKQDIVLTEAQVKYLRRIRAQMNETEPINTINAKHLQFLRLTAGDYGLYLSVKVPQILKAKEALLKTEWEAKDISRDQIESWRAPFNTLDPDKVLGLRQKLVLGIFDSSFRDRRRTILLGWGQIPTKNAIASLTRDLGGNKTFLSREEMEDVLNKSHARTRSFAADFVGGALGVKN